MSRLKYETGMNVATVEGAVRSLGGLLPKGTVGIIVEVDGKDKDLPYLVQFGSSKEWMFEEELTTIEEVD